MTRKTLTTILDEHRQRSEQIGALIFDAREIVRKRLKPGPSEDRDLFDMLHKLHYIHGGNTVEIDARPIADAFTLQPIASAPKDRDILVWYDHAADPYHADEPGRLTDYGALCECGDFLPGRGYCIAKWQPQLWESLDEPGGDGYWLPAYWFARQNDEYECVCNPTHWMDLPTPPETTP